MVEIGRRRIRDRIRALENQVESLSRQRDLRRRRRREEGVPVLSIIGYTNAGKSTLLNAMTGSEVDAADQLFMTLDPTSRRLRFPREGEVVVTDTVGFIADLPPDLVAAFRATLEELADADLLLHVVDAADPRLEQKLEAVERLLDRAPPGRDPAPPRPQQDRPPRALTRPTPSPAASAELPSAPPNAAAWPSSSRPPRSGWEGRSR